MVRGGHSAVVLTALLLFGCGDDGYGFGPNASAQSKVTVTPGAASISTADRLVVAIAVDGPDGAARNGTVALTSGAYSARVATLASGRASITVPAGVLAIGESTVSVSFTPDDGSAPANGSANVAVAEAATPDVTAQSADLRVRGRPFSALPVPNGLVVSVTFNGDPRSETGLGIFSGADPRQLESKCFQRVAYPNSNGASSAFGLTASPNGKGLILAVEDAGIALIDRQGTLTDCSGRTIQVPQGDLSMGEGSFDVAVTPDGKYAFVANEYGVDSKDADGRPIAGNVGVVALSYDASGVPNGGRLVGRIATGGQAIAGVTMSHDGTRLYVTSEIVRSGSKPSGTGNDILAHGQCRQKANGRTTPYGLLSVIDVAKAEKQADGIAIISTVAAGCSPVRTVETADGEVLWVAARGDNRVLAFSTQSLESSPDNALLGFGDTGGIAPVGLQLFDGGRLLAVANSNRFAVQPTPGNLGILAAVPVRPKTVQTVAAALFPRSVSVAADDSTLFLTNFDSDSVQIVSTTNSASSGATTANRMRQPVFRQ